MTPPGTPAEWTAIDAKWQAINTEWRALGKALEAKRTQDKPTTTREENTDPDTQPKPEGATTPPGTPTEWEVLKTAIALKPRGLRAWQTP